jgi:hypothetical protein
LAGGPKILGRFYDYIFVLLNITRASKICIFSNELSELREKGFSFVVSDEFTTKVAEV